MEHGYQKPIRDAFTGSLHDLPVYSMVGNNLNPRRRQPHHGGQQLWRQCHESWHTRERHQDTAKDKAAPATDSMGQSVLPTPDQEDDLTKLSEGTENHYGAFIEAMEQITRANPNVINTRFAKHSLEVTVPTSPQSVRMEENMDSKADGHDRNQYNIVEAQPLDPVADAIPVLEKLTAQLQTATKE